MTTSQVVLTISETLHSWELVNISDTTELGRQECAYIFASKWVVIFIRLFFPPGSAGMICVLSLFDVIFWSLSISEFHIHVVLFFRTAAEQREAVKSIKEAIKRSIKTGSAVTTIRSHSFRRSDTNLSTPSLNSTFPAASNSNFLRSQPDAGLLRRSFSHNPEEALTRRTSLLEDQHKQIIKSLQDSSPCYSDDDSTTGRVSLVVKDEPAKPVDMGTIWR